MPRKTKKTGKSRWAGTIHAGVSSIDTPMGAPLCVTFSTFGSQSSLRSPWRTAEDVGTFVPDRPAASGWLNGSINS